MPESPICVYCREPIDTQTENYVIPNKESAPSEAEWEYVHLDCYSKGLPD